MIKIPPPLIVLTLIISIYFSSKKIDLINIPFQIEISFFILSLGILIFIYPVLQFIKTKTTVDPIKFKKVNKLVTSGIFIRKILKTITNNSDFSNLGSIFYLLYPYLLLGNF